MKIIVQLVLILLLWVPSVFAGEPPASFALMKKKVVEYYHAENWAKASGTVKEYFETHKKDLDQYTLQATQLLYAETLFLQEKYKKAVDVLADAIEKYDSELEPVLKRGYQEYTKYIYKPRLTVDPWPKDEESCTAHNGTWKQWGKMRSAKCNLPTEDGGTPCSDSTQCQGLCVVPAYVKRGTKIEGKCSPRIFSETGCANVVSDRLAVGNICF